jgi:hypothetical protein
MAMTVNDDLQHLTEVVHRSEAEMMALQESPGGVPGLLRAMRVLVRETYDMSRRLRIGKEEGFLFPDHDFVVVRLATGVRMVVPWRQEVSEDLLIVTAPLGVSRWCDYPGDPVTAGLRYACAMLAVVFRPLWKQESDPHVRSALCAYATVDVEEERRLPAVPVEALLTFHPEAIAEIPAPHQRNEIGQLCAYLDQLLGQLTAPEDRSALEYVFRRDGDQWFIRYMGGEGHFTDWKGIGYIYQLLRRPNPTPSEVMDGLDLQGITSDTGQVQAAKAQRACDRPALAQINQRRKEIECELDECKRANDQGREDSLLEERRRLLEQLKRDTGLGGRIRPLGEDDPAKKAGKAAQAAIDRAIKAIEEAPGLEECAKYLRLTIRRSSGEFAYLAPHPVPQWVLD